MSDRGFEVKRITSQIDITDFITMLLTENRKWHGYIWYAASEFPLIINNNTLSLTPTKDHLHEAMLAASDDSGDSVTILFNEGFWTTVRRYGAEAKSNGIENRPYQYLVKGEPWNSSRIYALKFSEYLIPEMDNFCLDMKVLTPAWTVFEGFKLIESKKEVFL